MFYHCFSEILDAGRGWVALALSPLWVSSFLLGLSSAAISPQEVFSGPVSTKGICLVVTRQAEQSLFHYLLFLTVKFDFLSANPQRQDLVCFPSSPSGQM